jgi:hypothetical protein
VLPWAFQLRAVVVGRELPPLILPFVREFNCELVEGGRLAESCDCRALLIAGALLALCPKFPEAALAP